MPHVSRADHAAYQRAWREKNPEKARAYSKKRAELRRLARPDYERTCPICGKAFTTRRSRQVCCSTACGDKAFNDRRRSPIRTVVCGICGKAFTTSRSRQKYCSAECLAASYRYEPHAHKTYDRVCAFCGKAFTARYSAVKYCSLLCKGRARIGYATLADFEKKQAERKAAFNKQHERDRNGLTIAEIQEVIDAQNGDPSLLWKRSQSWTKAQRKYAKKRYQENHGLFVQTYSP